VTDDLNDITIGQPKIHVGSAKFHQHQWSINVWCGIVNGYIIGPQWYTHRCHVQWFSPKYTAI